MNPTPAKRARRSSSPSSPTTPLVRPTSASQAGPSVSPSRPILPPPSSSSLGGVASPFPHPSTLLGGGGGGVGSGGPSSAGWSSAWPPGGGPHSRRSMDAKSPVSPGSPRMEGIEETIAGGGEQGVVFARDTSSRAPRSMMACTRCRRQKMKCDGPSQVPCRGCRQSGQPCIFEARTRPKSISVLPSRPPIFAGRPATPSGAPGFYPSGAQPAPPALSRAPLPGSEGYAMRAREPMPPPPATSISLLASPYPPPPSLRGTPPPPQNPIVQVYHPPPLQLPPFSTTAPGRPHSPPSQESRLRAVESALRNLSAVPSSLAAISHSLSAMHRSVDSISHPTTSHASHASHRPIVKAEVSDAIWEEYRSRAWPLTPWLVGLREAGGLPGLVVEYLGRRAVADRSDESRANCEEAGKAVKGEISLLVGQGADWSREEIRALGVYACWTNDTALASLAVAHGRIVGLDRIWIPRKSQDDWREWIYLTIMDHMCHLVDFASPVTSDILATAWREKLGSPSSAHGDPAVRDRDHKLLAWLEYAEMLADVHRAKEALRREAVIHENPDMHTVEGLLDIWHRSSGSWDAWAGVWGARNDPVLSLYFHYALLFTASPVFFPWEGVWIELARASEGRGVLERGRDAAFIVVQALCSPEIGRTFIHSCLLHRPLLSHALAYLLHLTTLPPTSPSIISLPHISDTLRAAHECIKSCRPLDFSTYSTPPGANVGLLEEMYERGDGGNVVGLARTIGGIEPGRDLWRRLLC